MKARVFHRILPLHFPFSNPFLFTELAHFQAPSITQQFFLKPKMPNNSLQQPIQIFIRLDNGNGCSINLQKGQTFDQLIDLINNQEIQLPHTYRILFKGRHIKDYSKTIQSLGLTQHSILHIEEVYQRNGRPTKMDVCIFWNGEKYIVKSSACQKIVNLKQSIHKLLRIVPKDQLLVFKGCILKNQETLEHYRIKPDSLICLHTTVKMDDIDEQDSDYDQATNGFLLKDNNELLESVLSLCQKKSGVSKSTLFRSDSMGKKGVEDPLPYEIEIHHKGNNEDQSYEGKQFNFDLFKSFGMANPMTLSIGYNLFDSLKHPIDRFVIKNFEIKSQDEQQSQQGFNQMKHGILVDSITSFQDI